MSIITELEYHKLDKIDRKVLLWLLEHSPASIASWVDHIAHNYQKSTQPLNAKKLLLEIKEGYVGIEDMAQR